MGIKSLVGNKYGRLLVISLAPGRTSSRGTYWNCMCDCGNAHVAIGRHLQNGALRSCGCSRIKHGQEGTRLYHTWEGMLQRCYNEKHTSYSRYGGRGISVCAAWHEFIPFYTYALSTGYTDELTIDRINNDGNYEPGNIRWATMRQQQNNKSHPGVAEKVAIVDSLMDEILDYFACEDAEAFGYDKDF